MCGPAGGVRPVQMGGGVALDPRGALDQLSERVGAARGMANPARTLRGAGGFIFYGSWAAMAYQSV